MGLKSLFTTGSWNESGARSGGTSSKNSFLINGWETIVGGGKSGRNITQGNALAIPAVYAAVRAITDAISSLPIHVMKDNGSTKIKDRKHPLYKLLNREPNDLMTISIFWQIVVPQILLYGNSYCIIEFAKGSFRPVSLLPVHPDMVEVEIKEGILWYTFKLEGGQKIYLDQSNVLHFRGLGDTVMGKSVIDYARENLGLGAAAEEFGSRFFGNGAAMTGILESDSALSDKAYTNLSNSFSDRHGGLANAHKPLILEEGLKYKTVSISPDQAQFLETRRFSIEDIARWFKIQPHKIGDLSRSTFSNIEQQDLNFVKESVLPYVISIEQELNRKLLREVEKDTVYFKMNLDGLLRGDIKTRSEAYKTFIQNGIMNPNEARAKEEMNPYDGGDSYFMPLNLAPIDENGTNQQIAEQPVVVEADEEQQNIT
jgi:HK97 family phage portal protein